MELVQPIRDIKKIAAMKRHLLDGPFGTRNHLLFTLGINSGLRISDLLGLKLSDVLDTSGYIRDRITLKESKTGKLKDFPIGTSSAEAIRLHITTLDREDREQPLFASKKGSDAITRQHAWTILSDAAKAVKINDNIGTHTLRKTFGYHAYQAGNDITMIQKLLNHSSPAITLSYIGITQDDLDDVYLNLNL